MASLSILAAVLAEDLVNCHANREGQRRPADPFGWIGRFDERDLAARDPRLVAFPVAAGARSPPGHVEERSAGSDSTCSRR